MTKKDYQLIADCFAKELDREDVDMYKASSVCTWIIANLCRELALDNPNFNKETFITATKLNEHRVRNSFPVTGLDSII